MALIAWKEEYAVGHSEIDAQHRRLIGLVNELHDGVLEKGSDAMHQALDQLVWHLKTYFAAEERLLKVAGYPGLEAHRTEHDQLRRQVEQFLFDVRSGKMELTVRVAVFLRHWLLDHIVNSGPGHAAHLRRAAATPDPVLARC